MRRDPVYGGLTGGLRQFRSKSMLPITERSGTMRGSMRRELRILIAALPVLLLVGDVAFWRFAEARLQTGFQTWLAQRRGAGWKTGFAPVASGGWPLAATLTVPKLSLQGGDPDIPGGVGWSADRLVLRLVLWHPTELDIVVEGEQRLRFGALPDIPCSADRLEATMPLPAGDVPHEINLQVRNLRAILPDDTGAGTTLTIGLLQAHVGLATSTGPALAFTISAEAIGLPQAIHWALGPILSSFTLDGTLNGKPPLGHGLTEAATAWRDGGGSLEIRHLTLGWGPLGLTASATMALDDQLQPMGAGTGHIVGYAATLDSLAHDGVLSRSAVTAAKAVLSLLAGTPDDSGTSEVEVPLTLQYRTLSMRQVPLVRLPELDWPAQ